MTSEFPFNSKSESAQLLYSIDWTKHPLGSIESWPLALKITLGIIFNSQHPMFVWWGKELYQFYNDGYRPSFGVGKHPKAMGQRGEECWPEIWPIIKPQIDLVMNEGGSTWHENQLIPIFRNSKIEDVYWSYGYSPICDEKGAVEGVLVICYETTKAVLDGEKRAAMESELEVMIDQSPAAIALLRGADFIFEKVNARWQGLVSKREYLGRSFPDVYWEIKDAELHEKLCEVFETGKSFTAYDHKIRVETPDGVLEDRYYDISYIRIARGNTGGFGIFCHASDVTERVQSKMHLEKASKELESAAIRSDKERSKFETAFQAVAEGIFIFDSEGNPVFMNDAAAKVFGSESAEDVRKRVEYYFERLELRDLDDNFIPISEWPVSRALRGESFRDWQIKAYRSDTGDRWIWSSSGELARQRGTDVTLAVVVLRDITDQKKAEYDLQQAKFEAEKANEAKTAFLTNMSHEIRTPIGVIIGFCELMLDESLSFDERQVYLARVVKNAKGLTRIIDDILDLAKVEAGKLEIEEIEFSLNELLIEVVDVFSDRAKEKNISLQLNFENSLPRTIFSDPTRLRQILVNIIGNAVKFTTTGGVIVLVKSGPQETGQSTFEIRVVDTGIGIAETKKDMLFQPFVQAESNTNRMFGGTGLGLVISRRLAIALGGNIGVENRADGQGCTFTISFREGLRTKKIAADEPGHSPFPAAKEASQNSRKASPKLSGVRVLLAEDSADNQLFVKRILMRNGATVDIANDGEEAIEKALKDTFDLILMDVQMPRVDGYEATRSLRKNGFRNPIIALTAHAMTEEKVKSKNAGCNAHLTKPINTSELVNTIMKLVGL